MQPPARIGSRAQLATLAPPPPEMQQLLAGVAGSQVAMDAFVSVLAGTLSPARFFDPAYLASILPDPGEGRPNSGS